MKKTGTSLFLVLALFLLRKPLEMTELVMAVRALLDRSPGPDGELMDKSTVDRG